MTKIKLVDGTILNAEAVELVNGALKITISDHTVEELAQIFSDKSKTSRIVLMTESEKESGYKIGFTSFSGINYGADGSKTVELFQPADVTEARIANAEGVANSAFYASEEAKMTANSANEKAETANNTANSANEKAEDAGAIATNANEEVGTANENASTANEKADEAGAKADSANEKAGEAETAANNALDSATELEKTVNALLGLEA